MEDNSLEDHADNKRDIRVSSFCCSVWVVKLVETMFYAKLLIKKEVEQAAARLKCNESCNYCLNNLQSVSGRMNPHDTQEISGRVNSHDIQEILTI